jgi:hypothetical protein
MRINTTALNAWNQYEEHHDELQHEKNATIKR